MATYKGLDLSLEKNINNDLAVVEDLESIKVTLYNNILVSSKEKWFDDSLTMDMRDLVHEPDGYLVRKQITDAIKEAALFDPRINEILSVNFVFNEIENVLEIDMTIELANRINNETIVAIGLIFERG